MSLMREPILHFLVIGILFFVADSYWESSGAEDNGNGITISHSDIELITERYLKQMGRVPTGPELSSLINARIREEVFYREALAMGLDKDDTIVRRRLAQKLEFLSQDMFVPEAPEEPVLAAYYKENIERYRQPERVRFTHLYFSEDKRGGEARADALSVRKSLNSRAETPMGAVEMGDRSPAQLEDIFYAPDQLMRLFGSSFSETLFSLKKVPGSWQGPIHSGYGWHLVQISQHEDSLLPKLPEVRGRVLNDWLYETRQSENNRLYEILKTRYHIQVEGAAENPQNERLAKQAGF